MKEVHTKPIASLLHELETNAKGLCDEQITKRQQKYGENRVTKQKTRPAILKFFDQFLNFFSILLLVGSALSFLAEYLQPGSNNHYIGIALLGVTLLNAIFTFVQEFRAEQALKSFEKLMISQTTVLRNGTKTQISSIELVPGDIIILEEGDRIAADARIIEEYNLKVDHSSLTGESEPQLRSVKATAKKALLSRNMIFSGTLVQSGYGKAVVVNTGDNTEMGKIAHDTFNQDVETSHLQLQIKDFIKRISSIAIFLGVVFFILSVIITGEWLFSLIFAIGIIVANVPEGLLPTVTLTLSIATQKLAKEKALVKKMDAIETLGSLTVICSDKTGTLTQNKLQVVGFFINNEHYDFSQEQKAILHNNTPVRLHSIKGSNEFNDVLALCNNSSIAKKDIGDPTDIALKKYVQNFRNVDYIEREHQRLHEVPFSSETKFMATANKVDNKTHGFAKGAPEVILEKCTSISINGKVEKLTKKHKNDILTQNKTFSQQGYRILGCAKKVISGHNFEAELEKADYTFYGLIILQDPPRPEVHDAVAQCHSAGIKIIVISGDQSETVASIAKQVGVALNPTVISCEELDKYSDEQLQIELRKKEILFARALPKDKMRIVQLLKKMGEIVAVTGDGVNDAPALRSAHVGVSMGKMGTEVAKEASDIILLDDNFATLANAIKLGRGIYDNIKNFITYILTSNTPEIIPFLLFVLLSFWNFPLALPVLLILTIDLGTDMIPAIGLGVERPSKDIMKIPPRPTNSKLLNWKMIARSYGLIGPIQTVAAYLVFFGILFDNGYVFGADIAPGLYASAISGFLATIVITQIFNVYSCRTTRTSSFVKGIFTNKLILIGIASELVLLAAIVYVPALEAILGTAPFDLKYILWMVLVGLVILGVEELRKFLYRKYKIFGTD